MIFLYDVRDDLVHEIIKIINSLLVSTFISCLSSSFTVIYKLINNLSFYFTYNLQWYLKGYHLNSMRHMKGSNGKLTKKVIASLC